MKLPRAGTSPIARRFLSTVLLAGLGLAACGEGPVPDRNLWRPWYEDQTVDAAVPPILAPPVDAGTTTPTTRDLAMGTTHAACGLSVSVTTTSPGGRYSPRNVGAIWIADQGGRFVKTLTEWGSRRRGYLLKWASVTAAAGSLDNTVDAVTSATMNSFGNRTGSWNCTDTSRKAVADGSFQVCFEVTDYDGPGPSDCVPFDKGQMAETLHPADATNFKSRSLVFTP